jgi:Tfp pilus assembly protein PilX
MREAQRSAYSNSERGVALILVMLCIVVLSVLAASIVFSARSETFASYNYRTSLQADYVAKAGLQKAINYFNSSKYVPVPPDDATTRYGVAAYQTTPLTLYTATARPVICISGCASNNQPVTLSMSGSTFSGNYPTYLTNADGETIPTSYASNLASGTLNPLSASNNSGQFTVTAILESYRTVNDAFYPAINRKPYEVWYVTSTGTWTSKPPSGGVPATPTSVQEATLAPVYLPYFANALYGMCNITMSGNVCTDSYNSNSGAYNGSNPANCVTAGTAGSNAFASGAGIGSGGNVTLNGGSYVVNGDVSYGATAPTYSSLWACASASSGVTGNVSGVKGTVQPVPAIPEPPMPTFPSCAYFGVGGTSCNKSGGTYPSPPDPTNPSSNTEWAWVRKIGGQWFFQVSLGGSTTSYALTYPTWQAATSYSVGQVIAPGNGHAYRVTTAGTTGQTAPAFPTGSGSTVSDGITSTVWAASTAYPAGAYVRPSTSNGHVYKALNAGTSGPSQPAFPTASGATVSDTGYPNWAPNTSYTAGNIISPGNGRIYTALNSNYSGQTAPSWPTTSGATVTESYAVWNNQAYTVGQIVVPTAAKANGHKYICIVAGTATNPQPTWPTGAGATVVNGGVTWREFGSDTPITWRESGTVAAITWQEAGSDTPVVWTENGTSTNIFGDGTQDDPFRLPEISIGNNAKLCLTGSPDPATPIYYAVKNLYSLGTIYNVNEANQPTSCGQAGYTDVGYSVLNIYQTLYLGGPGVTQPTTAKATTLVINVYNSGSNSGNSVTIRGQANLKAIVTALGDASLGGGGSGGAFYGSLLAGSVTDAGTYSVHYDQSMQVISGKMMPMAIRNYNRPKY